MLSCFQRYSVEILLNKLALAALAAAISLAPLTADATTYFGTRTVLGNIAALTIETDGTVGVLSFANIVDWTLLLSHGATTVEVNSGNSTGALEGAGLTATPTDLFFDFSSDGVFGFVSLTGAYCVDGEAAANMCLGFAPSEAIFFNDGANNQLVDRTGAGQQRLGSAARAVGGVPEPAAWALMIAGFGMAGAALRGRRSPAKVARG